MTEAEAPDDMYMTREMASQYIEATFKIKCSPKTLAKFAWMGNGPTRLRAGKSVVYLKHDLEDWAIRRLRSVKGSAQ